MRDSWLFRIIFSFLVLLFSVCPVELEAVEMDSLFLDTEPSEIVEAPKQMTQEQINDLFGEDPYLGQTSYLQSPDGFSQRGKSKKWISLMNLKS